eukprot:834123-Rhodomonas_salina.1
MLRRDYPPSLPPSLPHSLTQLTHSPLLLAFLLSLCPSVLSLTLCPTVAVFLSLEEVMHAEGEERRGEERKERRGEEGEERRGRGEEEERGEKWRAAAHA